MRGQLKLNIPVSTNLLNNLLGIREPIISVSFDRQKSIVTFETESDKHKWYNIEDVTPETEKLVVTYINE